jgi:ureidoglycolate lyase
MLFRHDTHTQALMPLNVPAVIVVAPAGVEFDQDADADAATVRAFRIEPLESLVLHQGTWHWGPFPMEGPEVRLFNVQGLRYAEDNRCVDLASKGLAFEVAFAQ